MNIRAFVQAMALALMTVTWLLSIAGCSPDPGPIILSASPNSPLLKEASR